MLKPSHAAAGTRLPSSRRSPPLQRRRPAAPAQPPPKISLVVADKHCATIVQPFEIKDNTATLIGSSVKRGAGAAIEVHRAQARAATRTRPRTRRTRTR